MFRFATVLLVVALLAGLACAEPATMTFGTAPTLTEATPISKLNSEPQTFVDKDVLVAGKIVNLCKHTGCWVEIEAADSSRILCKSFGDKIKFSEDCLGQTILLQGKLVIDQPKAAEETPKTEAKVEAAAEVKTAEAAAEHAATVAAEAPATAAEAPAAAAATPTGVKVEATEAAKEAPHVCPVQKVMIKINGATVQFAAAK